MIQPGRKIEHTNKYMRRKESALSIGALGFDNANPLGKLRTTPPGPTQPLERFRGDTTHGDRVDGCGHW